MSDREQESLIRTTDPGTVQRSELQREADRLDCDIYRICCQLENLGQRIPIAGPNLRGVANQIHSARASLRRLMHKYDRERTS